MTKIRLKLTPEEWKEHYRKKARAKREQRHPKLGAVAQKALQRSVAENLAKRGTTTTSARGSQTGVGIREGDVWRPEDHGPSEATPVDDERRDKVFCRRCHVEVAVQQTDVGWVTCDLDGKPHAETCSNPPPPVEDW